MSRQRGSVVRVDGGPLVAAVAAIAAVLAMLSGCSAVASGGDAGATARVERYLELLATGTEADLPELWGMTANDVPDAMRIAGDMLVGAQERLEVVEIGDPQAVDSVSSELDVFDVAGAFSRLVQVQVRYRLGDTESTGAVLLGLLEDKPGRDAESWMVLGPLVGSIAFADVGFTIDIVPDVYISGIRTVLRAGQPLYPAVYEVQSRADPYLTADPTVVTVVAGTAVTAPTPTMRGTDTTAEELVVSLEHRFGECADAHLECPLLSSPEAADAIQARGIESPFAGGWWMGLTGSPSLTLASGTFEATGSYTIRLDDGSEADVDFHASGPWSFDIDSGRPTVFSIEVT